MTGTEVVKYEEGAKMIAGEALPEIETSDQAQRQILTQIESAEDLDSLFQDRSTTAAVKMKDIGVRVLDLRLRRSTLEPDEEGGPEKVGVYALIDAEVIESGEPITLNTGSKNVMMTLWRAKELGALPVEVVVTEVSKARGRKQAAIGVKPIGATLAAMKGGGPAAKPKNVGNVNTGK